MVWEDEIDLGEIWDNAVRKGRELFTDFELSAWPVPLVVQSKWTKFDQIEESGWRLEEEEFGKWPDPRDHSSMRLYEALDLPDWPSANRKYCWEHIAESYFREPRSRHYLASGASYELLLNPQAIFVLESTSPHQLAEARSIDEDDIPPLQYWSDIAFLQWARLCAEQWDQPLNGLRAIVRSQIQNFWTEGIIDHALEVAGKRLADWIDPDDTRSQSAARFTPDDEPFYAMLGSPYGQSVAHFLLQHKEALGKLKVSAMTVYASHPHPRHLNLCFHVEPVAT